MRYYIKEKTMTNDKIEYELKGLYEHLHLDEDVYDYCSKIEKSLKERFEAIDQVAEYNQLKVLSAFIKNRCFGRIQIFRYFITVNFFIVVHNSTAETDNISSNVNYRKHDTISEFIVYSALTAYGKSALDNFFCFKSLRSQIFKQMIVSFGCISQTVYRNRFPRYITFCKILLTFFAYVFITQAIIKKSR